MEHNNKINLDGIEKWEEAEKKLAEILLKSLIAREDSMATHAIEQAKTNVKKWFYAWIITMAILAATNAAWLYVFQSYDYASQSGNGINSINTGDQGDLINEPESEN